MTANELFTFTAQVSGFLGIVASMFAMGLGLTVSQIVQPLKNARLVVLALLANFVDHAYERNQIASSQSLLAMTNQ